MHCGLFRSIADLYPLDANRSPSIVTTETISRQFPPEAEVGARLPAIENHQGGWRAMGGGKVGDALLGGLGLVLCLCGHGDHHSCPACLVRTV